ncbi:hypothetical protein [Faecalispora anaeroviscerum]|uniref:hypothetical protein n=1 Tax=Faecalispora anaeroviscerum TaxID=2991836 RepID=UPI0024BBC671|nr:hypothetical protein [Faecalispora anaeroviscerum]
MDAVVPVAVPAGAAVRVDAAALDTVFRAVAMAATVVRVDAAALDTVFLAGKSTRRVSASQITPFSIICSLINYGREI